MGLLALAGCGREDAPGTGSMETLVERYLVLELAMGEIDPGHVDAYFGPAELRVQARSHGWSIEQIDTRAADLAEDFSSLREAGNAVRIDALLGRLTALRMRAAILDDRAADFDQESMALFGAVAPAYGEAHFESIRAEIDALLPGEGPLSERVSRFVQAFTIPPDRLDEVFRAAMLACRERTLRRIDLPGNERFRIEYVSDKPWSGYNWYEGDASSLIQVNTDLPTPIERAVDLGCHEGYPGHHTYNALVERKLVQERGWLEYTLYPLFSPQSLVAEGTANYGIELAFPEVERIAFERDVLFPLAGLDVGQADRYYAVLALLSKLSFASNEVARGYLNGDLTRAEAIAALQRFRLVSAERAAQSIKFMDTYRSYVVNYNLGKALVAAYIERGEPDADTRWERFEALLLEPVVPGSLGTALPADSR